MENIYNKLSNEDIEKITYYIENYANESKGKLRTPLKADLEYILRFWTENKQHFYDGMFNHQFIIKKHVQIEKNNDILYDQFTRIKPFNILLRDVADNIWKFCDDETTADSLDRNTRNAFLSIAHTYHQGWFTNKYPFDDCTFKVRGTEIKWQKGQKMTKILKSIMKVCYSEEAYSLAKKMIEDGFNAYSTVLNDKYISGNLCLSIHPLDFMTMSHNQLKWRSCMKWDEDGCYKQGTVEMMNSPNVIEAYLESSEPMTFKNKMTWSNKRWRTLYIVENDAIIEIKDYPYYNEDLNKAAMAMIGERMNQYCGTHFDVEDITCETFGEWDENYNEEEDEYVPADNFCWLPTAERIITGFETGFMYNDIYENSCNMTHLVMCNDEEKTDTHFREESIYYSGPDECMICGESIEDEHSVVCEECDPYITCSYTGVRLVKADTDSYLTLSYGDRPMYLDKKHEFDEEYYKTCVLSGNHFYTRTDEAADLGFLGDGIFEAIKHIPVSRSVMTDILHNENSPYRKYFKTLKHMDVYYNERFCIPLEDLTDEGLKKFDIFNRLIVDWASYGVDGFWRWWSDSEWRKSFIYLVRNNWRFLLPYCSTIYKTKWEDVKEALLSDYNGRYLSIDDVPNNVLIDYISQYKKQRLVLDENDSMVLADIPFIPSSQIE